MIPPPSALTPVPGMRLAFAAAASPFLADIPAEVACTWPRCGSGDYLVTLRYPQPVKFKQAFIRHIDALLSELYQPSFD